MSYEEILKELEEVNLKEKFTSDFEKLASNGYLKLVKKSNKINSTGSLLRSLISFYEYKSEKWNYWQQVLIYFMNPIFARKLETLPN